MTGRHYQTGKPMSLAWREDGRFQPAGRASASECGARWLAPPLVDLQVNGFAGVDFQRDGLELEQLAAAVRGLQEKGCAHFFPTLITDDWPRMLARLRKLRQMRAARPELAAAIPGWHIEGPFLSEAIGFSGAHDPRWMIDPAPAHLRELRDVAASDRLLLTLAPERPGGLAAIELATALGFGVSLGHTNASAGILAKALAKGARGFTHLGNACPQTLDRHDNILWRVLDLPRISVSLIPDGIHVSPALFRLVHRIFRPGQVYYVTDAMAAAGAPPGRYSLGARSFAVGRDGVVREPGKTNFAGSSLTPLDGIIRSAQMLGCSWQEVWPHFSSIPRRFARLPPAWRAGREADFCLLEDLGRRRWKFTPYIGGRKYRSSSFSLEANFPLTLNPSPRQTGRG